MRAHDDFEPGRVVGGHQIVRQLGTGTFGSVYEARRMPIGRRVALKVLHARFATHAEVTQRFLREAEVVARLEHPNIVGVIDLGVHEGRPFITMQLLEGETLAQRIARGPMAMEEALEHILPILSAVEAAHHHGVVHRDLKPENIYLELLSTGRVESRLLDFGIAKLEEASLAMTGTSAMMGTPYYMPPEQVAGAIHADARSDIWALGAILFEMVTGVRPFRGDTIADIFLAITVHPTPSVRALRVELPVALDAAISRALAKKAEVRWPSAREFALALLPLASPTLQAQWETTFGDPLEGTMVDSPEVRRRADDTQTLGTLAPVAQAPPRSPSEHARRGHDGPESVVTAAPLASTMFVDDVRVPVTAAPSASTMFVDDVRAPTMPTPRYDPSARPPPLTNTAFIPHGGSGTMLSNEPPPESPALESTMAMPADDVAGSMPPSQLPHAPLPGMPPVQGSGVSRQAPVRSRRRWWIALVAALLLVGGLVALNALADDPIEAPPVVTTTVPTAVTAGPPPATAPAAVLPVPVPAPMGMPIPTRPAQAIAVPSVALPDAGVAGAAQGRPHRRHQRRSDDLIPGLIESL